MLYLLQQMYTDLNLIEIFNIEVIYGIFYKKFVICNYQGTHVKEGFYFHCV